MSARCTLFLSEDAWRVVCVDASATQARVIEHATGSETASLAESAATACAELGGAGPIVVALPSRWCLSATVQTHDLGRSGRRQAMRYLLEEYLPISAEDTACDFVEQQGTALGVAAELDRLQLIIDALSNAGLTVAHVVPAALLAAMQLVKQRPDAQTLCLAGEQGIDLIQIDSRRPARWWWLADKDALHERLSAWDKDTHNTAGPRVSVGNQQPIDGYESLSFNERDVSIPLLDETASLAGARLLAGDDTAWIDLCQEELGVPGRFAPLQKHAAALVVSLICVLVSTIAATYWRGQQYESLADQSNANQLAVYQALMPGERVPTSIHSRLQSEQRRLSGLGGAGNASTSNTQLHPTSALTHLHRVLSVWPQTLRCQLADLTIEPDMIRINGQAADPVIPERLAALLRETGAYEVDDPNSRALSTFGFSFGFVARPIQPQPDQQVATRPSP